MHSDGMRFPFIHTAKKSFRLYISRRRGEHLARAAQARAAPWEGGPTYFVTVSLVPIQCCRPKLLLIHHGSSVGSRSGKGCLRRCARDKGFVRLFFRGTRMGGAPVTVSPGVPFTLLKPPSELNGDTRTAGLLLYLCPFRVRLGNMKPQHVHQVLHEQHTSEP